MSNRKLRFLSYFSVFIHFSNSEVFPSPNLEIEKGSEYWLTQGRLEIENAVNKPVFKKKAKNVILFLGDGMGITVNSAGRIYKSQKLGNSGEENSLTWEKFPNVALLKTYNLDKQVPDSAATATAYLGGVKANYLTVGVNGKVAVDDCTASLEPANWVPSVIQWGQEAGKDTGIVTTTRITHATPAVTYARTSNRTWECDAKMPLEILQGASCKDIARQLVEDEPGKNINVIFGGGRRSLGAPLEEDAEGSSCLREDGLNLAEEWRKDKDAKGLGHIYVTNKTEFDQIDVTSHDFVLGLFSGSHLPYEIERDAIKVPSLAELTEKAIERLRRNPEGFILLVEGGRIDHALHDTQPKKSLEDLAAMDEAVLKALNMVNLEETLLLVTADHSHVMTFNGYPDRGNDILGKTQYEHVSDNMPYPTLMFTNGVGFNFTWNGTNVVRVNLTNVDTTTKDYISPALVPTPAGYETHGGEDVAVWAAGPWAHLFHKTHEQTHVAHVMAYAACLGPYREDCEDREADKNEPRSPPNIDYRISTDNEDVSGSSQVIVSSFIVFISFILVTL